MLGKMIHIKEDQADILKITENIVVFSRNQFQKASLVVTFCIPEFKPNFYGSLSPFSQGLESINVGTKRRNTIYRYVLCKNTSVKHLVMKYVRNTLL